MKKSLFIDEVCAELKKIGISDVIIENQRRKMDVYLTSLDIGEESEELDDEDPCDFAQEIIEALVSAGIVSAAELKQPDEMDEQPDEMDGRFDEVDVQPDEFGEQAGEMLGQADDGEISEEEISESELFVASDNYTEEAPVAEDFFDDDGDVKRFDSAADTKAEEDHSYNAPQFGYYQGEEATLEFSAVYENTAEYDNVYDGEYQEDYEQEAYTEPEVKEDFIDIALKNEKPLREKVGNPTPFWILFGLFSPLILVLAIAFFALCGAAYALLALFMVLHIPMIVIAIGGGSLLTLSEVIYVIVQFAGGHKTVAFFEMGVAIALVGIIILITVGFKYLGKRSPRGFYYLTKIIRFAIHKIKRGFRWLKGVCSI